MRLGGIIFCDRRGNGDFFTLRRTAAAVPFACRFRLIDFPLSVFAHAGVGDVTLVVGYGFHSLLEHIGSGKPWELSRTNGGLRILSPYRYARGGLFRTRLEALGYMTETLESLAFDAFFLTDCDTVANPDLRKMAAFHRENAAALTLLTAQTGAWSEEDGLYFKTDAAGRIDEATRRRPSRGAHLFLGTVLIERSTLLAALAECRARAQTDLVQDFLLPLIKRTRAFAFSYNGPHLFVGDALSYYRSSFALLKEPEVRRALLADPLRPILTSDRPTPPTYYEGTGEVRNSLIAEGCRIAGRVENSLLFRGVTVGRESCVRNVILFGGSYIGQGCNLYALAAEKRTVIRDGVHLAGHPDLPLFIDQGKVC